MILGTRCLTTALAVGFFFAPLSVDAQPAKVPRIGFLCPHSKPGARLAALQQGLRELGYADGQNIVIDSRFAQERVERFSDLTADLISLKVDVIVPMGPDALLAAQRATTTIPIVMPGDGGDPVKKGFVASLARPGGNITGFTMLSPELSAKRLQLLKDTSPKIRTVAFLSGMANPDSALELTETRAAAPTLGLKIQSVEVQNPQDLERALGAVRKARADALIIARDALLYRHLTRIVTFAAERQLPTMVGGRDWMGAGALMSYGVDWDELYRRSAIYVDKILKGAKPADLPVEQPTRFELTINLKTAKALGLTIPESVLVRADKVIR